MMCGWVCLCWSPSQTYYLLITVHTDLLIEFKAKYATTILFYIPEPNLLSHTAHSVSKKGVKRRDLNDVELRDILAEILPLVRMDHVIPYNSEVLTSAIRRGLVSVPPSHMLSDESGLSHTSAAWVPGRNAGMYTRPRLFIPYLEEAKVQIYTNIILKPFKDNMLCWSNR